MNLKINALRPLRVGRIVAAVALAGLAQTALACNLGAWLGGNSGAPTVEVGQPNPDSIPRYSGLCAMAPQTGVDGWVQDNSPGGIDRIRARFYVLATNTESADVYHGYASNGSLLFRVLVRANGNVVVATGGAIETAAGVHGAWNSVEMDWDADAGTVALWVNSDPTAGDPPDATSNMSSPGGLDYVRLGNLNEASGVVPGTTDRAMAFDAYESRRSTAIGRLMAGDANGDTDINVGDITAVANERFDSTLALGQPDCNEDGSVDVGDITCLANIIFG